MPKKSIFIHIPKTAGTSLRLGFQVDMRGRYLSNYPIGNWTGCLCIGHISLRQLIDFKLISQEAVEESCIFTFIRDPRDRMVSLYYHFEDRKWHKKGTFSDFCYKIYDLWYTNKLDSVGLYNNRMYSQANPQVNWLKGIACDYIGSFEKLFQNYSKLCRILNIVPMTKLPHEYPSKHRKKTEELYNKFPEAEHLVYEIYKEDLACQTSL